MKTITSLFSFIICFSLTAQTKTLKAEPNHSTIGFSISIAGFTKVTGKFTDYELAMDWNEDDLSACKLSSVIQATSINTGIDDRDAHLRTADFFDVEQFPTINFVSTSIEKVEGNNYKAIGTLTMHGVTKDFILPFKMVKIDGNTLGVSIRTTLNRKDYGIGTSFKHTAIPGFLSDTINVEIDFWTKKRKE